MAGGTKHFESDAPSTLGNSPDESSSNSKSDSRNVWHPPGFDEDDEYYKDESGETERNQHTDEPDEAEIDHDLPGKTREPDIDRSPDVTKRGKVSGSKPGPDWSRATNEENSKSTLKKISDGLGFIVLSPFLLIRWVWGLLKTVLKYPATILLSGYFWIAVLLIGGGAIALGPGAPLLADIVDDTSSAVDDASSAADDALSTGADALADDDVNTSKVESEIHTRINEIRTERGLQPLKHEPELRKIARGHSEHMATEDFFSHESPNGDTFEDRYRQAGYDCRVPEGGNRYSTGGENIAYTYASSDIDTDYGGTVNHNGNETKIARGLVKGWMNSPGHRENILKPNWKNEGIGVAIAEVDSNTKVYATQNFC